MRQRWNVALILLLLAPLVTAGSYSVHPVKVSLSTNQPATTIKVHNRAQNPVTLQLAPKQWRHLGDSDELTDTRDLIVVPPVFTMAPGATQIVRVGLRHVEPVAAETPYRLLLQEIPSSAGQGLQLALNMSLPVFVAPTHTPSAKPVWSLNRSGADSLSLGVENQGTAHFKFTSWRLRSDNEDISAGQKLRYVLPGGHREWTISPKTLPKVGDEVELIVVSGSQELRTLARVQ